MAEQNTNVERVDVFQGKNEEWYWAGFAANGEEVASSAPESYTRAEDATRAAEATFPGVPTSVTTVVNESTEE